MAQRNTVARMASKRPAGVPDQTSEKRLKLNMPGRAPNEVQEALDLAGELFQQKQAVFAYSQEKKAAEAVQDQKNIAVQIERIQSLESQLSCEKSQREGEETRSRMETAMRRDVAESDSKHAAYAWNLEARLVIAEQWRSKEQGQDKLITHLRSRLDTTNEAYIRMINSIIWNKLVAATVSYNKLLGVQTRLEDSEKQMLVVQTNIEDSERQADRELSFRRQMEGMLEVLSKEKEKFLVDKYAREAREDELQVALLTQDRGHRENATQSKLKIQTVEQQQATLEQKHIEQLRGLSSAAIEQAHVTKLQHEKAIQAMSDSLDAAAQVKSNLEELQSLSKTLSAAMKVKDQSKGIPFATLGSLGAALGELRHALTSTVQTKISRHSSAHTVP